ncbi:alpha/beta fold hydrolase [Pseudoalteromonas sp. T1lg48]|uniref:alpha/beta fold hydrolase n=1 Tax=Pseudoalteromonas sp. T1lg48 TaxID=2077100 RepID=UPI000CF745DA|nr:alpha/beta fold hydrolase [Pseudoalteromonas sp. T1lg48]
MALSYPIRAPRQVYHLAVAHGHQLEIEEHGNRDGFPVIICHDGPGAGLNRASCAYFNPEHYRIFLYSQRGCGNSTPHSCEHNTLDLLVADVEQIRDHFGLSHWSVCGEGFGALLALCYAFAYPRRMSSLLLWASYLAATEDQAWSLGLSGAAAHFYPQQYELFNPKQLGPEALAKDYQQRLFGANELTQIEAANAWCAWQQQLGRQTIEHDHHLQQARLQLHYLIHRFFLADDHLLEQAASLKTLPVYMVHGRYDLRCSFARVQRLATRLQARLQIVAELGRAPENEVYCQALCRATDHMYLQLKRSRCKD